MQDDRNLDTSQDDIMASFREERLEQRRKKPAILIGVSIGVVLAVAIGGLTYGRYVSVYYDADSGNLPVIRADSSVDGMRPATPGGMEVPNRDKLVYERLRQSNTEVPVERLLPVSEKPHVPAVKKEEKKEEKKVPQSKAEEDPIAVLAAGIIEQKQSSALIYEEDGTPVEEMELWKTLSATYDEGGTLVTDEELAESAPLSYGAVRVTTAGGSAAYPVQYSMH